MTEYSDGDENCKDNRGGDDRMVQEDNADDLDIPASKSIMKDIGGNAEATEKRVEAGIQENGKPLDGKYDDITSAEQVAVDCLSNVPIITLCPPFESD